MNPNLTRYSSCLFHQSMRTLQLTLDAPTHVCVTQIAVQQSTKKTFLSISNNQSKIFNQAMKNPAPSILLEDVVTQSAPFFKSKLDD